MNAMTFLFSLTAILGVFLVRHKITEYLNERFQPKEKFQSEWIVYILTIFFIIVISYGMLLDTKKAGPNVSDSIENLEPAQEKKPHPWFDINFDVFNF